MSNIEILEQALKLRPEERYVVVEGLLNSLDIPTRKSTIFGPQRRRIGLKLTEKEG